MCRYAQLISTLQSLANDDHDAEHTIGAVTDNLDANAFAVSAILISLPFLQPFPLGLFALIGSAAYWSLGWQLLTKHGHFSLPNKVRAFKLTNKTYTKLFRTCLWLIKPIHRIAKPRLKQISRPQTVQTIGGVIFLVVGILVAIPLGGVIPFRNFFPALAILLYTVGELEQDGLLIIMALLCLCITILIYSTMLFLIFHFGTLALHHFMG